MDKYIRLNYFDFLSDCKANKANNLNNFFNLDIFMDAFEEISNNEILLYRHRLENILEAGLHALIKIQFVDSLVLLRNEENVRKLDFNMDSLNNISFLMRNLVNLFNLTPRTLANEIYDEDKIKVSNGLNMNLDYKSPERVKEIMLNIELQSLSFAFGKQHKCQIERKTGGNIFFFINQDLITIFRYYLQCKILKGP